MKRLISIILCLCMMVPTVVLASTFSDYLGVSSNTFDNSVYLVIGLNKALVNGDLKELDVPPFVQDDRTLVPVRFISENMGANVIWKDPQIIVNYNGNVIIMEINKNSFSINGTETSLDVAPCVVNDRTFIPLRAMVESLGKSLYWDERGGIFISDKRIESSDAAMVGLMNSVYLKMTESNMTSPDTNIANIRNGSIVVIQDDFIYFTNQKNGSSPLYRMRTDGSMRQKITDDSCVGINVVDGWIYYRDFRSGRTGDMSVLSRIRTDGSKKEILSYDPPFQICVQGSWVYYLSRAEGAPQMYKVHTDGSEKIKISNIPMYQPQIFGEWIYYSNSDDDNKLYRMKTDGTENCKISDVLGYEFNIVGEWIYYSEKNSGNLKKMKIDGSNQTTLNFDKCYYAIADGDHIFYSNASDGSTLYSVKTDGSNRKKLSNNVISFSINVINDWIFYVDQNQITYSIRKDGSDKQILY